MPITGIDVETVNEDKSIEFDVRYEPATESELESRRESLRITLTRIMGQHQDKISRNLIGEAATGSLLIAFYSYAIYASAVPGISVPHHPILPWLAVLLFMAELLILECRVRSLRAQECGADEMAELALLQPIGTAELDTVIPLAIDNEAVLGFMTKLYRLQRVPVVGEFRAMQSAHAASQNFVLKLAEARDEMVA